MHNKIAWLGWGTVIVFTQTFCIFPAVFLQSKISFIENESWQVWFIATLFNVADMISKYLTEKYVILNSRTAFLATISRCLLIGIAFLSAYEISIFSNDYVKIANLLMVGFTNGYVSTCQMILACNKVSFQEKEITSKIIVNFIMFGTFLGSFISSFGFKRLF